MKNISNTKFMAGRNSIFYLLLILFSIVSKAQTQAKFPQVSEPIQITKDGKEHFYASYYGITSFNKSQRYATVLQTDIKSLVSGKNI